MINKARYNVELELLRLNCKIPCYYPLSVSDAKRVRGNVLSSMLKSKVENKRGAKTDFTKDLAICELLIEGYSAYSVYGAQKGEYPVNHKVKARILSYFKGIDRLPMVGLKGNRKQYSLAFKIKIAQLFLSGRTLHSLKSEYKISSGSIERWVNQYSLGKFCLEKAVSVSLR